MLEFARGVRSLRVFVQLYNDSGWEPDEFFFVELSDPMGDAVALGLKKTKVFIVDDDAFPTRCPQNARQGRRRSASFNPSFLKSNQGSTFGWFNFWLVQLSVGSTFDWFNF